MTDELQQQPPETDLTPEELRQWLEFSCWTALVMAPILYWLNGPSVSTDQFVVRTALVVIAACGAIGLRLTAWLRRRKSV